MKSNRPAHLAWMTAFLAFFIFCTPALAQGGSSGFPFVHYTEIDHDQGLLYIYGRDLYCTGLVPQPRVTLADVELNLQSFQADAIAAEVPAAFLGSPGTYSLTLISGCTDSNGLGLVTMTFAVIGAGGTQGPKGDQGDPGPQGPRRAAGTEGRHWRSRSRRATGPEG
jgi:hypothetical protein